MVTFGGAEWERGRFSKIRARQSTENEQGYNFISGFYMLGPKLRGQQVFRRKVGHTPCPPLLKMVIAPLFQTFIWWGGVSWHAVEL